MTWFKQILLFSFLVTSFNGIIAQGNIVKECKSKLKKNDFQIVETDLFDLIYNDGTIPRHEVKFKCVYSAIYTSKVMYDHFGKWDEMFFPEHLSPAILIWRKVKLFPDDNQLYTVVTHGKEEEFMTYTSIMVSDQQGNDVLEEGALALKAIDYFKKAIRANNDKERAFYKAYWKEANPDKWKKLYGKG